MSFKTFTSPGGQIVNGTLYLLDPGLQVNGQSSGFRPIASTDLIPSFASVSNSAISGSMATFTTGVLLANPYRDRLYAQVVGSGGPLYIAYNGSPASATNFNVLLAAASTDIGTNGGVLTENNYTGPVSVSGFIGCRFILWEGSSSMIVAAS